MMNSIQNFIAENGKTDSSGKWMNMFDVQTLCEQLVKECIAEISNTGKQCALTTRDLNIVECTIAKSVDQIKNRFPI